MGVEIFNFLDGTSNSVFVTFNNVDGEMVKVDLLLNNNSIKSVMTVKDSYLFNVETPGNYHVELSTLREYEIKQKVIKSNSLEIKGITTPRVSSKAEVGKTTTNVKINGIDEYYLELKILKNKVKELNSDLNVNLKLEKVDFDLSFINENDSFNDFDYFVCHDETNFEHLEEIARRIEELGYVDYCCIVPDTNGYLPPRLPLITRDDYDNIDDIYITPNFMHLQTYLNEPYGMNVINTWNKKINGSRTVVRHLDFGLYRYHENLIDSDITVVNSRPETENCNHGTASTGCIVAAKGSIGVAGIAHGCKYYFYDTNNLDLIVNDAQVGDIISLDIQFKVGDKLLPATHMRSWWERISILISKGATVILAAGNGGLNLSVPGVMNDYGDNGSMLVGACYHNTGRRVGFSNYGHATSYINSWGDWSVTTTGYGSLQKFPGNNRNYSKDYAGTSSATPLCSGALALVQDYAKSKNVILSAWSMRRIVGLSNYSDGVQDGIGRRPNVDYLLSMVDKLISLGDLKLD